MVDWQTVAENLRALATGNTVELNDGQRASLEAVAERLPHNGIIIADEVGMGKTRIATTVTKAVIDAGGRVAILVPPGLGFQWSEELRKTHVEDIPEILRSLDGYLYAWSGLTKGNNPKPKAPAPWVEHKALVISHAFCNWQVKSNARNNSKWALLPLTMALTQARIRGSGRLPHGAGKLKKACQAEVVAAAEWITGNTHIDVLVTLAQQDGLNKWGSESCLLNSANYTRSGGETKLRDELEHVVGLGLGKFDLVIIDEAHKSRGTESNLERLLKNVILVDESGKRLAMTATPVELAAEQWQQMLGRINVQDDGANTAIGSYGAAVKRVRQLPSDQQVRNEFSRAAEGFQTALGQYLLRRDKRELESVKAFSKHNGNTHSDYRRLSEILVSTSALSPEWKQAVCAAEALSFVTRGVDDQTAKRLRLTLGNGHGISALMDEPLHDEHEDLNNHDALANAVETGKPDKKVQRIEWWKGLMTRALQGGQGLQAGEAALYEHPAILAAVEAIEAVCEKGEKVLVFGRFTRPMQALVRLLNAREMLRSLDTRRPWPQATIHQNERDAISAALRQLKKIESLESVNKRLDKQYKELENERERFRTRLRSALSRSLADLDEKEHSLTILARPIQEILGAEGAGDDGIVRVFKEIVAAASDQDRDTDTNADESVGNAVHQLSEEILQRIADEYGRNEGGFARLMNGSTKPPTRRLLQLAFNRKHSNPQVLVAQSVVGREGLNLHQACRTVILLHAEWNPGIVEQQIGRVDRINSLWEEKLKGVVSGTPSDELPRIEIHPVIFQGTYDEHNWKVLMQRWDDLRAQLHGVVITPSKAQKLPSELVKSINDCAPNFSPIRQT